MGPVNEIPYLIKAKNGEHWFLMNQLFGVLSAEVAASLGISSRVEAARELFERETAVYKPLKAYQDTGDVDASDARRDKSYRRFDLGVQSAELSDDTSVADAAKRVRFVLNQMSKKLTVKAYAEETAEIFDLIDKLEKDHSEDVETIGQTANLAALKEANEAFNEIYKRRTEEMQAREEAGTVEQIRPQVDEAVRYVICLLNALYFYYLDIAPDAEKLAEVKRGERRDQPIQRLCPAIPQDLGPPRHRLRLRQGGHDPGGGHDPRRHRDARHGRGGVAGSDIVVPRAFPAIGRVG